MDSSAEIFGVLYQEYLTITKTECGYWFSFLFRLEKPLNNYNIDVVINGEIRPPVDIYIVPSNVVEHYWYLICYHLPPDIVINDGVLSIKNACGLQVGLWNIHRKIEPKLECDNCGSDNTPLWRMEGMRRYCNACSLYLKRNGFDRRLNEKNEVIRQKTKREKKFRACAECNTTLTPLWRRHEHKIYCNKHGLAKKKRQKKSTLSMWRNVDKWTYSTKQRRKPQKKLLSSKL